MIDRVFNSNYGFNVNPYGLCFDNLIPVNQGRDERNNGKFVISFDEVQDDDYYNSKFEFVASRSKYKVLMESELDGNRYLSNKSLNKFPCVQLRLYLGEDKSREVNSNIHSIIYRFDGDLDIKVISEENKNVFNVTFKIVDEKGNYFSFDIYLNKEELKNFEDYFDFYRDFSNDAHVEVATLNF